MLESYLVSTAQEIAVGRSKVMILRDTVTALGLESISSFTEHNTTEHSDSVLSLMPSLVINILKPILAS